MLALHVAAEEEQERHQRQGTREHILQSTDPGDSLDLQGMERKHERPKPGSDRDTALCCERRLWGLRHRSRAKRTEHEAKDFKG